ncbi:MAG TPA: hypothetical protein VJB96_01405 [Patescibacteria group bacterium]|nr:hypothetical protein [Patescibacteria group bacterium]
MPLFQFIGATIGASVVVTIASLVWPKVTSQPRPEALTRVRDVVMQTQMGQGLAETLGVSDEEGVTPVNISDIVTTGTNAAIDTVTKSAQRAVTSRLLESLGTQFNTLPEEEKATFRAQICTPPAE